MSLRPLKTGQKRTSIENILPTNHKLYKACSPSQHEEQHLYMEDRLMRQQALNSAPSRHDRWYEKLLLNPVLGKAIALSMVVFGSQLISYQSLPGDQNQFTTLGILTAIFLLSAILGKNISRFPGGQSPGYTIGTVMASAGIVLAIVLAARLQYARLPLAIGISLMVALQYLSLWFNRRFKHLKFAVIPYGETQYVPNHFNIHWRRLNVPSLEGCRFDGLVVDMSVNLSPDWARFVTSCNVSGIPIFDAKQVYEALEGKVDIGALKSNDIRLLQPSPTYIAFKRLLDITASLILLPFIIPVCILTAIGIKLDSPGPILFIQKRVGHGNREFKMYKFRSMKMTNCQEPRFADEDAHRITRLGSMIRKYRIDELPQIYNVLTGQMSLIGPRPEQSNFVEKFEAEVPYYGYRHIVKPGITGWAQVSHGYSSDVESTKEKVEHDFYYIKHISFWLDTLIILRTMKTIITGFGAK